MGGSRQDVAYPDGCAVTGNKAPALVGIHVDFGLLAGFIDDIFSSGLSFAIVASLCRVVQLASGDVFVGG